MNLLWIVFYGFMIGILIELTFIIISCLIKKPQLYNKQYSFIKHLKYIFMTYFLIKLIIIILIFILSWIILICGGVSSFLIILYPLETSFIILGFIGFGIGLMFGGLSNNFIFITNELPHIYIMKQKISFINALRQVMKINH